MQSAFYYGLSILPVEPVHPAVSGTWQHPSLPWQVSAWPQPANPIERRDQVSKVPLFVRFVLCLPSSCTPSVVMHPAKKQAYSAAGNSVQTLISVCTEQQLSQKVFFPHYPVRYPK